MEFDLGGSVEVSERIAAARLGVSRDTLRHDRRDGRLGGIPFLKLGEGRRGLVRYDLADLERFVFANSTPIPGGERLVGPQRRKASLCRIPLIVKGITRQEIGLSRPCCRTPAPPSTPLPGANTRPGHAQSSHR
jgi:hypothetical protein